MPVDFVDRTLDINLNTINETLDQLVKVGLIRRVKGKYMPAKSGQNAELCILLNRLTADLAKLQGQKKQDKTVVLDADGRARQRHVSVKTCKLPFRRLPVLR